jgi:hypothetical protein
VLPSSLLVFVLFLCMFLPAFAIFFFRSFFLSFLSLFVVVVSSSTPHSPPHQIQSTPQGINRSSDSHTHIRKINSHSRLLKVKISSGVVLGDCRVGFCNVSCRFTLFSTHSLIAQCRLHHSISPQSVIGGDMNRAVPLQPHRTTRLVLAGPLHIIPLGK